MYVQAFISQAAIERFNEGIFNRFARPDKVKLNASPIGPILQGARLKFRPMIDRDGARPLAFTQSPIKHLTDRLSRHPKSRL